MVLSSLSVNRLALVEKLQWSPAPGFIAVTGETGAGKSVIIGALKLILGERSDTDIIRTGEQSCEVEAIFELPDNHPIYPLLEEAGIEPEQQLIIKRIVGKPSNRQLINQQAVTLKFLKQIGGYLIDLHRPMEQHSLLSTELQLSLLDRYGKTNELLTNYQKTLRQWQNLQTTIKNLQTQAPLSEQEQAFLSYQLDEIEKTNGSAQEEEDLSSQYTLLSSRNRLLSLAQQVTSQLNDGGLLDQCSKIQTALIQLNELDASQTEMPQSIERVILELQEIESHLSSYASNFYFEPGEEKLLEERLDQLQTIKRKYGPTWEEITTFTQNLQIKLSNVDEQTQRLEQLQTENDSLLTELDKLAQVLTEARKKTASQLAKAVSSHLNQMGFNQAVFDIHFKDPTKQGANGYDNLEFYFGPNLGEPTKPLAQIASSGELSRLMLALKSPLSHRKDWPVLVFDEIDANIGGETSKSVGQKMAALAQNTQVITITHFPQVASLAQQHMLVKKQNFAGRTVSQLTEVTDISRVEELVRMLGGGGEHTQAMAVSLLKTD